jgi:chromosomal replication initiation ATPase DnaA
MERRCHLQAHGVTFEMLVENEAQWLDVEPPEVLRAGKKPLRVKAQDLLCYFANRELKMSTVELAKILTIGQSAISRSVQRVVKMAENGNLTTKSMECIKS